MGLIKGGFMRLLQTLLYAIIFCCAAIILGIYSYYLSVLADRNTLIPTWEKAVEGLSGAAVVYLIFATVLTCCLGGVTFFAILAFLLDILFAGAMIAIAVLTRHGASSCKGIVNTPLGVGPAKVDPGFNGGGNGNNITYEVHYGLACRLNTACFAVSIIAAFLFLCTALMQLALIRTHRKEKRFGPSPDNNYTSGYGNKKRGLFSRKKKDEPVKDTELGNGTNGTVHPDGYAGHGYTNGNSTTYTSPTTTTTTTTGTHVGTHTTGVNGHGGYYTQPTGTAANPYGYNTTASTNY